MSEHHISEDRLFFFEKQEIVVQDFEVQGFILDIGGGGEGVIGQLKGQQVVAIDPRRSELEEAAPGPLKIIMDAKELKFLDGAFHTATSFFTLMYIENGEHATVFDEVFRVLAPGGRFLVWDVIFPTCMDEQRDVAVFPLLVKLPDREINTGYGMFWPPETQNMAYYLKRASEAGFEVVMQHEEEQAFFMELRKPEE